MVKLSVIIVNYNVKFFLQQAIRYALRSANFYTVQTSNSIEVIVVDNNSKDGSVEAIERLFPDLIVIANKENTGFSTANNQGINIAKGEYVLLLNPDTIVQKDTFLKCIHFMDNNLKVGGLGVKMIDGKGNFLPESKRGLPTPKVALFKMIGLSSFFPKSKVFNQYHLGFLDKNDNHKIQVLSGAFMFMRKETLNEIGLLDETFFMYGEDIDLSYRIILGGYENYYLSNTKIVHYKGESTKKGSLNYVRIFYNAMIIFARKHFAKKGAGLMILPIKIGIYLRAFIAIISRFLKQSAIVIFDILAIAGGIYWIQNLYALHIKQNIHFFEPSLLYINLPIYTFIWLFSAFFLGAYDRPYRSTKLVQGLLLGTLIISAIYGFLDESLRSSRALILFGTIWAILSMNVIRKFFNLLKTGSFESENSVSKKFLFLGDELTVEKAQIFLQKINPKADILGFLSTTTTQKSLGVYTDLATYSQFFKVDEIVFCEDDVPASFILDTMEQLGNTFEYKIFNSTEDCIIGSNSKNTAGDFYAFKHDFNLTQQYHRRNKRVFDVLFALLSILLFYAFMFSERGRKVLNNAFGVLWGKKTWVAYCTENTNIEKLPKTKKGVFNCVTHHKGITAKAIGVANSLYAKDYTVLNDLKILMNLR